MVGPQAKRYTVHKRIICPASSFFRSACSGNWRESRDGHLRLCETKPATFDVYICFLYTNEVDVVSEATEMQLPGAKYDKVNTPEASAKVFRCLVSAFILGDMLNDAWFTNAIVDEFVLLSSSCTLIPAQAIELAWQSLMPQWGLMGAIMDAVAVQMTPSCFKSCAAELPPAFVIEVAQACFRDRNMAPSARGIFNRARCFYHDHFNGEGKTKCCETELPTRRRSQDSEEWRMG